MSGRLFAVWCSLWAWFFDRLDTLIFESRYKQAKEAHFQKRTDAELATRNGSYVDPATMAELIFEHAELEYIWLLKRIEHLRMQADAFGRAATDRPPDRRRLALEVKIATLYAQERGDRHTVLFDDALRRTHSPTAFRYQR